MPTLKSPEFTLTLLTTDSHAGSVIKHHMRDEARPNPHAKLDAFLGNDRLKCVLCSAPALNGRHGFLCRVHQVGEDRYHVDATPNEVDGTGVVKADAKAVASGVRLGSHHHLMRQTIWRKVDGSLVPKFPW